MALEVNANQILAKSGTTTSVHEVGLMVRYENKDTKHKECKVFITACLRNTSYDETRYQHVWNIHYAVDDKHRGSYKKQLLPAITTATMKMKKGQWYRWGKEFEWTIPNDGKSDHNVGLYVHCKSTTPRFGPPQDGSATGTYLWLKNISTPKYTVTPSTPAGITVNFDEAIREMKISWSKPTNTVSTTLACTLYNEAGISIHAPDVYTPPGTSYTIKLPDTVARVDYTIAHKSSTGHTATASESYKNIPTDCKVWIKLSDGKWVKAVPWVKLPDGTWKKATKTYTKVGDAWKRTIM